ncbi:hypothetical protein JYT36_00080 [Bacteroidales bacterium AH-315-N07]|nr:hypothetical protein [Bacteroidales bacterium AH-315-N07]
MKKLFLITISLMFVFTIKAQDIIIFHNGDEIKAVVMEVGTAEIKYKKYENQETSPVYAISKDKVFMIRYADGTKDVFKKTEDKKTTEEKPLTSAKKEEPGGTKSSKANFRFYIGGFSSFYNSYRGGDELQQFWNWVNTKTPGGAADLFGWLGSAIYFGGNVGFSIAPKNGRHRLGAEFQVGRTLGKALWKQSFASYTGSSGGNLNQFYFGATFLNIIPTYAYALNKKQTILWVVEIPGICIGIMSGQTTLVWVEDPKIYTRGGVGFLWATGNDWMVTKNIGITTRFGYRGIKIDSGTNYGDSTGKDRLKVSWSGWYGTTGLKISFN